MTVCGWVCIAAIFAMIASVVWFFMSDYEYMETSPMFPVFIVATVVGISVAMGGLAAYGG